MGITNSLHSNKNVSKERNSFENVKYEIRLSPYSTSKYGLLYEPLKN